MRVRFTRLDALLLLMALIWGANYSIIKVALRDIPPIGFNALRLLAASGLFLAAIWRTQRTQRVRRTQRTIPRRDWAGIVFMAVIGQFLYQVLFMAGLVRTSVANSSLIIGCTPIVITLVTAALGHERIAPVRWAGAALSAFGIYLVVGHDTGMGRASLRGDLLMCGSVLCWTAMTVGARPLLRRHSPLVVTGYSMAIGALMYLPLAWRDLQALAWRHVPIGAWLALGFSAAFGLFVAYVIWYTAVQRLGNTRTSAYSNLIPVIAMLIAAVWFGEHIARTKAAGAAAVLLGVALTKLQPDAASAPPEPV